MNAMLNSGDLGGQGTRMSPGQAAEARERILARNERLERVCPDAVDLSAEAIAALHERLHGRAAEIAGDRSEKYFCALLRADKPITGEDLARLAIQAPADVVAWFAPLLLMIAHGAPHELTRLLEDLVPLLDTRLQQAREIVSEIHAAVAVRMQTWREQRS